MSTTTRTIFFVLVALFIGSGLYMAYQVNANYLEEVPIAGGTLIEGVVGLPRFINPVLSVTDVGKDIANLVYSGLMKKNSDGTFSPDLAESYVISDDGRTYTFTLKNDLTFHDGKPLTTDDIEYTIQKVTDASVKSPERTAWANIEVEKIDSTHIAFTLPRPYAAFLDNTTLGILPKHIWGAITGDEFTFSSFNENAIGSGPYKIASIKQNAGGIPTSYTLESFSDYAGGKPLIDTIIIRFYSNEKAMVDAYVAGEIESLGPISPENAEFLTQNKKAHVARSVLPRVFGIFFNQNQQPLFLHTEVKAALSEAIDKESLLEAVFGGYAEALEGPLPLHTEEERMAATSSLAIADTASSTNSDSNDNEIEETASTTPELALDIREARMILEKAGWTLNADGIYEKSAGKGKSPERLSFSLSTADTPELTKTAEFLKTEWQKMGAEVSVKIFSTGDLNQNVIQPRTYDALLFGQIVTDEADLYAFWHSSQRNNPGLNIALYTNSKADKVLEDLRVATSSETIAKDYAAFETELNKDKPAIFLYSPDFLYVVPEKLKGFTLGVLEDQKDRWNGVSKWYIETDSVWKFFLRNK